MWRVRSGSALAALCLLAAASTVRGGQPDIAFNRDILPTLSNNCFACHGPDAPARKAGLRLDLEEQAKQPLENGTKPIDPGNPDASLIMQRITAGDPADRMPPPETGKSLTGEEQALLARWIAAGAEWQPHWAFIPPARPVVPAVADAQWTRNPVDNFIRARLELEGFSPSPEADRHTLIRRVSLTLTGLPPSPAEIAQFVGNPDPNAYENLVDRLLASPNYGEHMARYWLDMARYADTNGYAADIERTMWRYRDWVIAAFNDNMPFDQFTIEQLAGDLLPQPTLDQQIATGFNRNHPIMMEGGAIFEEYRVSNVVDRVDTTSTTWLGLTMKCAQCHDHKYDPVSQREFFALYAFFNNITEEESRLFGTELDGNSVPRIKAPLPGQQSELARLDEALAEVHDEKNRPLPMLDTLQRAWEPQARAEAESRWTPLAVNTLPAAEGSDTVRLQGDAGVHGVSALRLDILPPAPGEDAPFTLGELAIYSGPASGDAPEIQVNLAESVSLDGNPAKAHDADIKTAWRPGPRATAAVFAFAGPVAGETGTQLQLVLQGPDIAGRLDRLRFQVSTDPAYLPASPGPWQISGPYTAADPDTLLATQHIDPRNIKRDATGDNAEARWQQPPNELPEGKPHNLAGQQSAYYFTRTISAPSPRRMDLRLDNRNAVKLWVNGRLVLDKAPQRGEVGAHPAPVTIELRRGENHILMKTADYYDFNQPTFYFQRVREEVGEIPLLVEAALRKGREERSDQERHDLRAFYRSRHWANWQALHEIELDLAWKQERILEVIPTTMVMEEREEPRPTHVLIRGEYDQPGEPVTPGVPAALHPWPEGAPQDRLGFAQWLVAPENPLTARVTVNRLWQRIFGEGLVRTPDDFGIQGARPTHPELLDWLAMEFIASGWDVKALQRLMVTTATFRQVARVRPDLAEADPENRLLARGPRFRLDAEMIRDSALAASGLLVSELGGPSVKPYQPPGLWKDVAYGGGGQRYTAQEFIQDHGDDLYRRSLYTFWKRAAAPPGMLLFDAPNRDICTARRGRSNTPLQALVLMNDTQYFEAARALAQRVLSEAGATPDERIQYAALLALGRPPRPAEQAALTQQFHDELAVYRANPDAAKQLLETGESPYNTALDAPELAAWTMVANALLNTDAAITLR